MRHDPDGPDPGFPGRKARAGPAHSVGWKRWHDAVAENHEPIENALQDFHLDNFQNPVFNSMKMNMMNMNMMKFVWSKHWGSELAHSVSNYSPLKVTLCANNV